MIDTVKSRDDENGKRPKEMRNITLRNGETVAQLNEEPNHVIEINNLDDMNKVGIMTPDWK